MVQLVRTIHRDIIVERDYCEEIKQKVRVYLSVYMIKKLLEIIYIEIRNFSVEMNQKQALKQLRIIDNLVRYK